MHGTSAHDDDLRRFEAEGAPPLPEGGQEAFVEHDGARIWHAAYGSGPAVILLHGGLGHGGNWAYQVPALLQTGHRVVLIDSRGHGRSTRDDRPFAYATMAGDLAAAMDSLGIARASLVGWSDGAVVALTLAMKAPERVSGVFFFGCNVDASGAKAIDGANPILKRCLRRHAQDYAKLSATPDRFRDFAKAVSLMQETQPDYSAAQLSGISVPVTIVHSEHDEFIRPEHAEYLARTIPLAKPVELPGVSHFAPLQRPEVFNAAMLEFLQALDLAAE